MKWIPVSERKPKSPRDINAPGTPVIVYSIHSDVKTERVFQAFYGRRVSGKPEFYLYGAIVHYVTHWQPMPKPPTECK